MNQDALGRHADLAAVEEGAEGALEGGVVEVGVLPDDGGGLAAELEEDGLEVLARQTADDAADAGGAGEVDLLDGRLGDEVGRDAGGVLGGVDEHVEDAGGEAGLVKDGAEAPHGAGAGFAALEDGRVAGGDGEEDGADAEDVGGVPDLHVSF